VTIVFIIGNTYTGQYFAVTFVIYYYSNIYVVLYKSYDQYNKSSKHYAYLVLCINWQYYKCIKMSNLINLFTLMEADVLETLRPYAAFHLKFTCVLK
jgi:hypothetical protein